MMVLPIKKKWYDMIESGEKAEEYREMKPYYASRFARLGVGDGSVHEILLRNGYSRRSPTLKCSVTISQGRGNVEWGAEANTEYFILKILRAEAGEGKKGG